MSAAAGRCVRRLLRFSLSTREGARLAEFYQRAFGCRLLASERLEGAAFEALMGVQGGASSLTLALGSERIELLQFDRPGEPSPPRLRASDLRFQHFALVVRDMARAYRELQRIEGWTAISSAGPERLPAADGGVSAFKFRDPEGHPLELLSFADEGMPAAWVQRARSAPATLVLGIDHSALSVADSARSEAFYRALGLWPQACTLNEGPVQSRLDGLSDARVQVSALKVPQGVPHVELLCYRGCDGHPSPGAPLHANDIGATRLVFEAPGAPGARLLHDPDGHALLLLPEALAEDAGAGRGTPAAGA